VIASTLAGFLTSLVLITAIGAQNAFLLRQGLRRVHVVPVVVTFAVSDAVLIAVGIAGLGAAVEHRPAVLHAMRWAGVAFLAGYAVVAARRALRPGALTASDGRTTTLRATLLMCLGFTYLNPHVYLDTVLLLGAVAHQHAYRWLFGAGAALASIVWFTGLGVGARRLAPLLARPAAWRVLDGLIAAVMAGLAAILAFG
jgi:L-lysine exporter family protein LysE/ArgO